VLCCVVLAVTGAVAPAATAAPAAPPDDDDADNPCVGTMDEPAGGMTVVSVQGYNPDGTDRPQVVGIGPEGEIRWVHRNGAEMGATWSYDVDRVGEDKFIASPRNFDQVVLLNQTTGDIELTLGEDENFDVMERQHQPDYLESEDGDPTFLIADSGNDRIVEYEHTDDGWENTWTPSRDMRWTRDADRLPNGNTLIADTVRDRVIAVAPDGEVVWEVYTPHHVYEVERIGTGDESSGPTMPDQNATGDVELHGDTDFPSPQVDACERYLTDFENEWPGRPNATTPGENGTHGDPTLGDGTRATPTSAPTTATSGDGGAGPPGAGALAALVALFGALALARRQRR
jgi:hypothetical protein